jgi:hypothetical protein
MQRIIAVPNTTEEEKLIWVRETTPLFRASPCLLASHVCGLLFFDVAALPH